MKRSLWALLVAVPLVVLLAAGFGHDPNASASPLLNKPAPAFALTALDGTRLSLADLRGKPVVLNFWASWCDSCKVEHPYLRDLWRTFGPKGATFVGIAYHDDPGAARTALRKYHIAWPVLQDGDHGTAVDYGVSGVPETFLIDRHGIVRFKSTGPVTPAGPVTPQIMAAQIGKLLRGNV